MRIAIVGGTGKQGTGFVVRWARAGHEIRLGSRDAHKAEARAAELATHGKVASGDNAWAAADCDVVVLTVPWEAHGATLDAIADAVQGKIVIDVTVPLVPPKVSRVHLPKGEAAALQTQARLGSSVKVVAAFHHVSSTHLADPDHVIDCDVLVAGDDAQAKQLVIGLARDGAMRALDAGPLVNAIALESLTPVLIHLNKTYKSKGSGIVFTDLPGAPPR